MTAQSGGAAAAIEQTLARMIPPVLDFLARLIGLGDIATPVRRAIEAIRSPIDRVLDRIIGVIARGLRGAAGALGRLLGRGGGSGAATAETEAAQQQRLREGVRAGVTAFNRFSGRPVGERVLRPLLWTIKTRYRLGVLEPVIEGEHWAVHGELRRMTEATDVPISPPLRPPADRHYIRRVKQNTVAKERNTVIESGVDVAAEVAEINAGRVPRVGNQFTINGRIYEVEHNTTLFPVSGPGFHQLDRGAFKCLGIYNRLGDSDRAREIMDRVGYTPAQRDAARAAWRAG